ncbi:MULTISPECIES: hypothetical protein [unclassified Pseudomonas]|uniref:hypothetical protein n=1 Tax=unclassified Pseudomonas TaxID=196821 RepID=UPI00117B824C|nr:MULTISPECIES: hypothetical protein [unclassified Pseudomonas]NWD86047.1 hypothetical protein [Pseudomonas sp. K5002]
MIITLRSRTFEFVLFLSGYFFYRFQYGSENEYISFNLGVLQIAVSIYAIVRYPVRRRALIFVLFSSFFLLFLQIAYYANFVIPWSGLPGDGAEYLYAAIRLWVYLFFVCIYALTIARDDLYKFCDVFIFLSRFSVVIAVASLFVFYTAGVSLLLNTYFAEHLIRPQAFLSEPSSFAPIAAVLMIVGWLRKSKIDIALSLIALSITFSPISILTTLLAIFLYSCLYGIKSTSAKIFIFVVAVVSMSTLFMMDCANLVVSLNGFERTTGRVSCGVQVIFDSGLRDQLQDLFTNQRLTSTFMSMDLARQYGGILLGFGLNSSSIFMPALVGEVRENSLWISMFLFYGIIGVLVFLSLVVLGMLRARMVNREFVVFYLSVLVASTINSAGGFYLYSLLYFSVIVILFGRKSREVDRFHTQQEAHQDDLTSSIE